MNATNLGAAVELSEIQILQIPKPCAKLAAFIHHLYKLEKVKCILDVILQSSGICLSSLKKYWISLLGLESPQNSVPCYSTLLSVKLDYRYFAEENLAHP